MSSAARTINTVLSGDASSLIQAAKSGGDSIRQYQKTSDDAKQKLMAGGGPFGGLAKSLQSQQAEMKKGGGLFGGLGKSLRAEALEARKGGENQLKSLLMGGAVVGGAGVALEVAGHWAKSFNDNFVKVLEGQMDKQQLLESTLRAIPVFGQAFGVTSDIQDAYSNYKAMNLKDKNASGSEVYAAASKDQQRKWDHDANGSIEKLVDEANKSQRATDLMGRHGLNVIDRKQVLDARDYRDEMNKLATELEKNPIYGGKTAAEKQALASSVGIARLNEMKAADLQARKQEAEERNSALRSASMNNSGLLSSNISAAYTNRGMDHAAYLEGVNEQFRRGTSDIGEWSRKMQESFPEAGRLFAGLELQAKAYLERQRQLATEAPGKAMVNSLKEQYEDMKAAMRDHMVDRQLQKMADRGVGADDFNKSRAMLQYMHDAPEAKAIHEAAMTPLENLKKEMIRLQELKDHDAITSEDFERAKGGAGDKARNALGIGGTPHGVAAESSEHGFTYHGQQRFDDPLKDILGVTKSAAQTAQQQLIALNKLVNKKGVGIVTINSLPGN